MLLIGDDAGLDRLRESLQTTHTRQWQRLYEQCQWYRSQTPPAEHPSASITYFGPAAANLALAYKLTGQRHYLDEAWRWLSVCLAYPHWGKEKLPDHDLDAGWLLHGLSLAYSWIGDDLTPEQREQLRAKLDLQGSRLYDYALETEGRWWSSAYWQNHNWICYAGLATAGYALGKAEWTGRARDNFERVFSLLATDGSDYEGVVYWRYGVPWLAIYADLVQRTEGIDLWTRSEFLARTLRWRLHQSVLGFAEHLGRGDCHDRRSGHSVALYYALARAYRDPLAAWLADLVGERLFWREAYESGVKPGVMPEAFLELLWYDSTVAPFPPLEEPLTSYFPDLGQVCTRTSWTDPDATVVTFASAPGGGNRAWDESQRLREQGWETLDAGHHHPDAGAFLLTSHGAQLVVDDGYANAKCARQHNLVLVDGQGWFGDGTKNVYRGLPYENRPELTDVLAEAGFVHATSRTAMMYDRSLGVRRLDRTLVVTPAGRLVIRDVCAADAARRWEFLLHTDWATTDAGDDVVITSGPGQAFVRRFAGTPATVARRVTDITFNPTGSTPSLIVDRSLQTTTWTTEPVAEAIFWTVIEPTSALSPREPVCVSPEAGAFDFGDEQVVFAGASLPGLECQGAAAIRSRGRLAVVGARSVSDHGWRTEWAEPYTGVVS